MNVCTIIAKNYLAHARVLGRSLAAVHPESRLWTLIIDDYEHYIDPAREPFEVITPADVGCHQFTEMALRYSILELSTAVKPWLMRHLMRETGGPVTYLDPDIKVYGSLQRLHDLAAEHGLVLTPHNNRPVPADGRRPTQVDIMIAGVYNLGYVTLAPRPEIDGLIDWWADRLLRDCRVDPIWGYFVDQRWFDLAPGLVSDLAIVRDPEYNAAYWNIHSRRLEHHGDRYTVDGRPLAFFHFSGFDPDTPLVLSRHQNRVDVTQYPALERILAEYAEEVMGEGHAISRRWPYTYSALGDGTPLDPTIRALFDDFSEERRRQGEPVASPFSLEGMGAFDGWIRGQAPGAAPGVSRALAYVHRQRDDLRSAFPDLNGAGGEGLLRWAEQYGRHEVPVLARAASHGRGVAADPPASGEGAGAVVTAEPAEPFGDDPWGVNVVARFGAGREADRAARGLVVALDAHGVPSLPIEPSGAGTNGADTPYAAALPQDAPFAINLLPLGGDLLQEFVRAAGRQAFAGRYSIGLSLWPLDQAPDTWRGSLSLLEELWVPSAHAADALAPDADVPVTTIPLPVEPEPFRPRARGDFGLPDDAFLFLARADPADEATIADPAAVIQAFSTAALDPAAARLVLRCPSASADIAAAAAQAGAIVIDRHLSPAEEQGLTALCDCYVSLHRATSFGLAIAEAMWHGKPVIATGYSGNLEYTTAANSLLVDGDLVPVPADGGRHPARAHWTEPSVEHAAALMRRVVEDREAARATGARAAEDIRRTHSPQAAGAAMARRLEAIRATGRVRLGATGAVDMPPAVAELPLRVRQAPPPAAPGPGQRAREVARRGVLRLMRPVTVRQQRVNEGLLSALLELHRGIVELRREDAAKRANLLTQLRAYERLLPLADEERSGVGELKRILTYQTDRSLYLALSELRRRHQRVAEQPDPEPTPAPGGLHLAPYELRVFSQNGEDGVIAEILRRIGATERFFVEFGVETGREGNCVYLADVAGWRGLFMDGDDRFYDQLERKYRAEPRIRTAQAIVTPENVERLFGEAGVPAELDVMSIDVDGQDYWIWQAIENWRPRTLVIEYNSALDPRRRLVEPAAPAREWDGTAYFGASLGALQALGERKGYRLVHTELSGANAFFVRSDLAGDAFPAPEEVVRRGLPNYFQSGYQHPPAPADARYVDLDAGAEVYVRT